MRRQANRISDCKLSAASESITREGANHMLMRGDRDLELDFIREFAVGGDLKDSRANDRRERIRLAIYGRNLLHEPFRDSGMDYGQAYQRCYGRPIEMRRTV
jgi:hypothetical protein